MATERKTAVYYRRKQKGLTLFELQDKCGIPFQRLQAYESGLRMPRVDSAIAVAKALGSTVEELFEDVA